MQRGLAFAFIVWVMVSVGIGIYGHLNSSERLTVIRSVLYGFVTAVIAGCVIAGIVILF
jgi:hypothetical protein